MPWHRLGFVADRYPKDIAEAREWAGLAWNPAEENVYRLAGVDENGREVFEVVDDFLIVKRDDTEKVLDIKPAERVTLDNGVPFDIAEALIEASGLEKIKVEFETAGGLDGGKRVWVLLKFPERHLTGDPSPHQPFIFVANSHDGSAALRCGATSVRIVCANTERMADLDAQAKGTAFTFRHTKNVMTRITDARAAIQGMIPQIEQVYARGAYLLNNKITPKQQREFVEQFAIRRMILNLGAKRVNLEELLKEPRVVKRVNATVEELEAILASETCRGVYDTAYGLTQAVIEYLDHFRIARGPKSDQARFTRTVLDGHDPQKQMAHALADEVLATV